MTSSRRKTAAWSIRGRLPGTAPGRISLPVLVLIAVVAFSASAARAGLIPLGAASNYAVLYEGTGGHNLGITGVGNHFEDLFDTISGNIGVGGTGNVTVSGPVYIEGYLDFSAANTGQYSSFDNAGPTSVNYRVTGVTTALSAINALSAAYSGGTNITFTNSGETINENTGALVTIDGIATRVFNVTAYSANNASVLDIVGDGTGDPVVFNFAVGTGNYGQQNVNLGGSVELTGTGLTSSDQVLFNFQSSSQNISLTNNGETFIGIILAPNDEMQMGNATLVGRFFGGDSTDETVEGADVYAPEVVPTPIPGALFLLAPGLVGLAAVRRRFMK
jgi:choice-of-anchor A domain-containing protein